MEGTQLTCAFLLSQVRGQAGRTLPQEALTEVTVALSTWRGHSCGPVSSCGSSGPRPRTHSHVLWRPSRRAQGARCPDTQARGAGPSAGRSVAEGLRCHLGPRTEVLRRRGNGRPSFTDITPLTGKNSSRATSPPVCCGTSSPGMVSRARHRGRHPPSPSTAVPERPHKGTGFPHSVRGRTVPNQKEIRTLQSFKHFCQIT